MTEQEEFEFRHRFETEQASKPAVAPEKSFGSKVMQQVGNVAAGALRGAGSIGATLLAPIDMTSDALAGKGLSLQSNRQRRADMDSALGSMGAETDSLAYGAGKLGGEIAGTAGAGGVLANALGKVPGVAAAAPNLLTAMRTNGMTTGASSMGALGNTATRVAGGAAAGGFSAGIVNPEDAGTGAAIGGAAPAVLKGAGWLGSKAGNALRGGGMSPDVEALAKRAAVLGIDIPADRLVNSRPLNAIASGLNYVPLSGRAAVETTMERQLNQATSRLVGQDTPNMTKALRDASTDLGGKFEATLQNNSVQMTPTFRAALAQAENRATAELAPGEAAIIHKQIADIQAKGAAGAIDGQTAYNIKKTLDRIGKRNSNEAYYATDLKKSLMEALNDSLGPTEAAAFKTVRQQYGNMLDLEKIAKNGAEGDISVARLANMRNINNPQMQEIANIAAQFVKPREGQHGAMQRGFAALGVGGSLGLPALAGVAAAGRVTNSALNSNLARNALTNGATSVSPGTLNLLQGGYRAAPLIGSDR